MASSRPSIAISSTQGSISLFDGYFHEPQKMTLVRPYFDFSSTPKEGSFNWWPFSETGNIGNNPGLGCRCMLLECCWRSAWEAELRLPGRQIPTKWATYSVRSNGSLRSYWWLTSFVLMAHFNRIHWLTSLGELSLQVELSPVCTLSTITSLGIKCKTHWSFNGPGGWIYKLLL